MHAGETGRLGHRFETEPNALNAIRLALATTVIVWHAYALPQHAGLPEPVRQILGYLPVDGFFAISGFLICRAWRRDPHLGRYLLARGRRILPGLWVCLLFTAFVIAPLTAGSLSAAAQWHFVLGNASTWYTASNIGDTLAGVPDVGVWNGSLWSLGYEAACYLSVAVLGMCALLRSKVVVALVLVMWTLSASMVAAGLPLSMWHVPRVGLMFACGALLWSYRARIPMRGDLAAAALVAVALGSFLPDYRIVAAPAVAYLMMWLALELGRYPRLVLRNDLSYGTYVYAFPVQQAILASGIGLGWLSFAGLSIAATLPLAAMSWFFVEKPAQRLGRRRQLTRPHTPSMVPAVIPEGMPAL